MEFDHFASAQAHVYDQALRELAAGQKQSHWMWFVFPQLSGLGSSAMSRQYAITSLAAAGRYLEHDLLGARLIECTQRVLEVQGRTAQEIFGYPDWMKFRSSMTLFSCCSPPGSVFHLAINKFFGGEPDLETLRLAHSD